MRIMDELSATQAKASCRQILNYNYYSTLKLLFIGEALT